MSGGYTFTSNEYDLLKDVFDAIDQNWDQVKLTPGLFSDLYAQTLNFISASGGPKPGVDEAVWQWVKGAQKVNDNEGDFAEFIREYTRHQYNTRNGTSLSESQFEDIANEASNSVGRNFFSEILYGLESPDLPSLNVIGQQDAGAAASDVFGGNYSPWAGTLLFTVLGLDDFFRNWILTLDDVVTFKNVEGTYDLFAAADSVEEVIQPSLLGVWNLINVLGNNGVDATSIINVLKQDVDAFIESSYKLSQIQGYNQSFNVGDDIFGVGALFGGDYVLGSYLSDSDISGDASSNIIHAGMGSDFIKGSDDDDLIDGGEGGFDTLSYQHLVSSPDGQGITITTQDLDTDDRLNFNALVTRGNNEDAVFNIEKIVGTIAKDELILNSTPSNDPFIFEGIYAPGPEDFRLDSIDASALTGGVDVLIDLSGDGYVKEKGGSTTVTLENVHASITGTDDDDVIIDLSANPIDSTQVKSIYGNDGDDQIIIGPQSYHTKVYGGAGKDVIIGGGPNSYVWGGEDEDIFLLNPLTRIEDGEAHDKIYLGGVQLLYGQRTAGSEDPYAREQFNPLVTYGKNKDGELVIGLDGVKINPGGQEFDWNAFVANYNDGISGGDPWPTAGIYLYEIETTGYRLWNEDVPSGWVDTTMDLFQLTYRRLTGEKLQSDEDPLVLDLDGDGLELQNMTNLSPKFDLDDDGFAEFSGWAMPDDGFLVRDLNSNGTIDDLGEMFGSPTQSGFSALAALDTNSDGKVDASDTAFSELSVWQDLNTDGITDTGELQSLTALGIESISTASTPASDVIATNIVTADGTYTRTDATTGTIHDVNFTLDNFRTTYLGDPTVSGAAAALPNLKGYGVLPDLHIAMTQNAWLLSTVQSAVSAMNSPDMETLRSGIDAVLQGWAASAEPIPNFAIAYEYDLNTDGSITIFDYAYANPTTGFWELDSGGDITDSNGDPIAEPTQADVLAMSTTHDGWDLLDGADLHFMEKYYGEDLPFEMVADGTADDDFAAIKGFIEHHHELRDYLAVTFAVQGPLSGYFLGIDYNAEGNFAVFETTNITELVPVFEEIFQAAPSDPTSAQAYFSEWKQIFNVFINQFSRGEGYQLNTVSYVFQNLVAAYESVGAPLTISELASAFEIDNIIDSAAASTNGTTDQDIFYLNAGNETVNGGDKSDVYVIGGNFGQDVIADVEAAPGSSPDMVRFANILSTEVSAQRQGNDLIISVNGTSDTLTIVGQFDKARPSATGITIDDDKGVTEIVFADGVVWSAIDMARAVAQNPAATDDTITGTKAVDYLDGGAGNDFLEGGDSGDVYVFDAGYGQDTIEDNQGYIYLNGPDIIHFGSGISYDDVTFSRTGASDDLIISVDGTSDVLTVKNQFKAIDTGPLGVQWLDRIEMFLFDDGTTLNWDDIIRDLVKSTDGDDTINGFYYQDRMDGGLGNDILSGGDEGDIYYFGLGYGDDQIHDNPSLPISGGDDKLVFGYGISPDDVILSRSGTSDDLGVSLANDNATLTITNQFKGTQTGPYGLRWFDRIETFEFNDGTVWTATDIMTSMVADAETSGDDTIYGFDIADTLIGGTGNDYLSGGNDSDTYLFNLGDGVDTVEDNWTKILYPNTDSIIFGQNITEADIVASIAAGTDDLVLSISGTNDQLILADQFDRSLDFSYIEELHFDDLTVVDGHYFRQEAIDSQTTSGDDTIYGTSFAETLTGGSGNDTLEGRGDGDTYLFGLADGQDVILDYVEDVDWDDPDKIVFGPDIATTDIIASSVYGTEDLILQISGTSDVLTVTDQFKRIGGGTSAHFAIEEMHFADTTVIDGLEWRSDIVAAQTTSGDDVIFGFDWKETLTGGAGTDRLEGGGDGDTYLFNLGDGHDTIYDYIGHVNWDDPDIVVFGSGISTSDISLSVDNNDLIFAIDGTSDQLTIEDYFLNDLLEVEEFHFEDSTVWTGTDIENILSPGSGGSNVTHPGTAGDDNLYGTSGDDVFEGGLGDDYMSGYEGADTYIYISGDGADTIVDTETETTNTDRLEFTDLNPLDVELARSARDFYIKDLNTGSVITVDDQFYVSGPEGLEEIVFADATVWGRQDMASYAWYRGTASGESISGTSDDETFFGDLGDDTIFGYQGDDTFVYSSGDGNDTIYETNQDPSSTDELIFTDLNVSELEFTRTQSNLYIKTISTGDEITLDDQFYQTVNNEGIELITFADSTVWDRQNIVENSWYRGTTSGESLSGTSDSETFFGDLGDDTLSGYDGADIYVYGSGDGNDIIYESSSDVTSADELAFTDLNISDLEFRRTARDFFVKTVSTGDELRVDDQFYYTDNKEGIELVTFADSSTWDRNDITANAWYRGTTSGESISGTEDDETFFGDLGDDTLSGYEGVDTYIYRSGDGSDKIYETYEDAGVSDVLLFADLNIADLSFAKVSNDLVITDTSTSETVNLDDQLRSSSIEGVEKIEFADGTVWDSHLIEAETWQIGTSSGETLTGTSGVDVLAGLAGNDTLTGGTGDDKFVFAQGDGIDSITDFVAGSATDDLVDLTDFSSITDFSSLTALASEAGGDTTFDFGSGDQLVFEGVSLASLHNDDFILAA